MVAGAQETRSLKLPTVVFAAAAAGDWVTTYQNRDAFSEGNPLIAWLDHQPAMQVALGASLDVASYYAWTKVTRKHPKLRAVGLYGAAAFRIYLARRNYRARMTDERR